MRGVMRPHVSDGERGRDGRVDPFPQFMRPRKLFSTGLIRAAVVLVGLTAAAGGASAQSQRGLPRARFGVADLTKLRWLEGRWVGSADGGPAIYEGYHFANDSTVEITYFADSTFARSTGGGRIYLSVGRVFQSVGPGLWGAAHVDNDGAYFVPERNASNTFSWTLDGPGMWTVTMRSSATGRERVTTYRMRRVR